MIHNEGTKNTMILCQLANALRLGVFARTNTYKQKQKKARIAANL